MADLTSTSTTRRNLLTVRVPLKTERVYPVATGNSVVYGEAVKLSGGKLVKLAATTDVPYTIMLQDVDATAADVTGDYMTHGSVLGSEITFAVGALADFRDDFLANTQILIEE